MKNIKYILLGIFLGGIVLAGVGTGIAFWEYASFQYKGEQEIGEIEEQTKTLEYRIPSEKDKRKILIRQCMRTNQKVKEDKKVPEGMIQYEVTYNATYAEPYLVYDRFEGYEDYRGVLNLNLNYKKSDFEIFMENKDQILKDLKEKKIASYKQTDIKKVVIKVNPKTRKQIGDERF